MAKEIKIIIIGFGSIGQRHYRNLWKLGYRNVYVFDVDADKITDGTIKTVEKIDLSTLAEFKIAFVCLPNNLHLEYSLKCAQAGCDLFIEKPLSHNLVGTGELQKICRGNKLINMVGCNLRFNPCSKFAKEYLGKNKLGKIYSISHEFGYYLPYWRPAQDYRKNYAAKKSSGGGIILDDIHEFDLLFWLNDFMEVEKAKLIFSKVSDLEIETEDCCLAAFKFKNNVLGSVRCDYLQQHQSRNFKIVGERGNLEVDLAKETVYFKNKNTVRKLLQTKRINDNDDFIQEIKYFFSCVAKRQKTFNSIETARETLKYCLNR